MTAEIVDLIPQVRRKFATKHLPASQVFRSASYIRPEVEITEV